MNPQKRVSGATRVQRLHRDKGLCVDCSEPSGGRSRCEFHRQQHAAWALRYYHQGKVRNQKQVRGQETPELPFG
jgi:hypothetical protein